MKNLFSSLYEFFGWVYDFVEVELIERIPNSVSDWFLNAFPNNRWLWFHVLSGGYLAGYLNTSWQVPGHWPLFIVLCAAIGWEMLEHSFLDIKDTYGSFKRFYHDASGDVLGALFCAWMVISFLIQEV